MKTARMYLDVEFNEEETDSESLAADINSLLQLTLATDGILANHGDVDIGPIEVEDEGEEDN